ncbi:hypothetical protein MCOR25_010074 [Pyricularia grisea]|nr:hypothetical protein MCOR25_010074 [Pyricularia grisea]
MSPHEVSPQSQQSQPLQGVEDTLFTTLFAKARDAESENPILGDEYARPLLERCQVDLDRPTFRGADNSAGIQGIAARAKLLDGWVRDFLQEYSGEQVTVVHLGCGMDCRALRVARGPKVRWFDVDFPAVVDLRRRMIDPQPAGDYHLLACDARDSSGWLDQIPTDSPTLVIAEGVLLYWVPSDAETLIRKVVDKLARGGLIFDLTSDVYVRLSEHIHILQENGARWRWGIQDCSAIERLHPAIRFVSEVDLPSPEQLGKTLEVMFGAQFDQVKHELEISSGVYKPILRILQYKFER